MTTKQGSTGFQVVSLLHQTWNQVNESHLKVTAFPYYSKMVEQLSKSEISFSSENIQA